MCKEERPQLARKYLCDDSMNRILYDGAKGNICVRLWGPMFSRQRKPAIRYAASSLIDKRVWKQETGRQPDMLSNLKSYMQVE